MAKQSHDPGVKKARARRAAARRRAALKADEQRRTWSTADNHHVLHRLDKPR